jgi:hypothetical protein
MSGVLIEIAPFFGLSHIKANESLNCTNQGSKSVHVGSVMTTPAKVQMSFLMNTMSTCQEKELNMMVELLINNIIHYNYLDILYN